MMARPDITRSSTLIDPESLARPTSQFLGSSGPGKPVRRNSGNVKPLLSFDGVKIPQTAPIHNHPGSRSVFGVDTLWEREMAKLREIEAREKIEEGERKKREEEEQHKGERKDRKKRKNKKRGAEEPQPNEGLPVPQEPRVSVEPPTLPTIERAARRPPPPPVDDDEEESEDEDIAVVSPHQVSEPAWHAGSSDEENGPRPRRTTGVGLRYPNKSVSVRSPMDSDSDEDLPLAATLNRARKPLPTSQPLQPDSDEDEDEEQPLSSILAKAKAQQPPSSLLNINFDQMSLKGTSPGNADGEEDDDEPLALRASRIPPAFNNRGGGGGDDDDDDQPLALHPEQQRRTQYNMLAQQQQQQMMMQAQFHNSMFFNPPMMGSGFFPPPMATPMMNPMNPVMMMQPPISIPSPPPIHDAAKFGRVDRWRRDVAVEGEI